MQLTITVIMVAFESEGFHGIVFLAFISASIERKNANLYLHLKKRSFRWKILIKLYHRLAICAMKNIRNFRAEKPLPRITDML